MRFSDSSVIMGKGRLSSARREDNGDTGFILDTGGALVYKKIPAGSRQPLFSGAQIISYADDCFKLTQGRLERRGGFTYVPD